MTIDEQVAQTIIQQTGQFALLTVGAHNFEAIEDGVRFDINITPRPDGTRPEIMATEIILEPADLYKVTITRPDPATPGSSSPYFEMAELFFDQLEKVFIAVERGRLYGRKTTAHLGS